MLSDSCTTAETFAISGISGRKMKRMKFDWTSQPLYAQLLLGYYRLYDDVSSEIRGFEAIRQGFDAYVSDGAVEFSLTEEFCFFAAQSRRNQLTSLNFDNTPRICSRCAAVRFVPGMSTTLARLSLSRQLSSQTHTAKSNPAIQT